MKNILIISFLLISIISSSQIFVDPYTVFGVDLTEGLINYYKADDASGDLADDEGSLDLSVSDLTYSVTGKVDDAVTLNGTSSWGTASIAGAEPTAAVSLSVWFKTTTSAVKYICGNYNDNDSGEGYEIGINGSDHAFFGVNDNSVEEIVAGTTDVTTGDWFHVVGTFDGTTVTLYVDGSSEGTPATWENSISYNASSRFKIGTRDFSAWFNGTIDDIKVWDIGLSQAAVTRDYDNGIAGIPLQ